MLSKPRRKLKAGTKKEGFGKFPLLDFTGELQKLNFQSCRIYFYSAGVWSTRLEKAIKFFQFHWNFMHILKKNKARE
jgi:hypothetical protein